MKDDSAAFTFLIVPLLLLGLFVLGLNFTFTYNELTDIKQQTGVVSSFNQHDEDIIDQIAGSTGSYFNLRFEDGSYFEATGLCYDNIDRRLFEDLRIGDEITVTYFEKSGGIRKICAIEYNGETYLSLENVSNGFGQNERVALIVGPILMAVAVLIGVVLFVVFRKKYCRR